MGVRARADTGSSWLGLCQAMASLAGSRRTRLSCDPRSRLRATERRVADREVRPRPACGFFRVGLVLGRHLARQAEPSLQSASQVDRMMRISRSSGSSRQSPCAARSEPLGSDSRRGEGELPPAGTLRNLAAQAPWPCRSDLAPRSKPRQPRRSAREAPVAARGRVEVRDDGEEA